MMYDLILCTVILGLTVSICYVHHELCATTVALRQEMASAEARAERARVLDKQINQFRPDPRLLCDYNTRRTDLLAAALGLEWKPEQQQAAAFVKKAKAK